jgi:hypothetical protein
MKTILLAGAVALGLSSGAAFAATQSNGYLYPGPMPAMGAQATQQSTDTSIGLYRAQTRPDPTGQTVYGPHGEISLWAPDLNGGGDN